jgi:hypothetical protein
MAWAHNGYHCFQASMMVAKPPYGPFRSAQNLTFFEIPQTTVFGAFSAAKENRAWISYKYPCQNPFSF